MKGDSLRLNGDLWTVVDVAPAPELAEMVAVLLEEEGFVVVTKNPDHLSDALSSLGVYGLGTTYVLVPASQADDALTLIAATVTDYEGESLETLIAEMAEADPAFHPDDLLDDDDDTIARDGNAVNSSAARKTTASDDAP